MSYHFKKIYLFVFDSIEAFIWFTALAALALMPAGGSHFSLCPLSNAGLSFCPGCGLGHSVAMIFHGDFAGSLQAHPLGFLALGLLAWRIVAVVRNAVRLYKVDTVRPIHSKS